jgi:SAM-dependent methyltransferase
MVTAAPHVPVRASCASPRFALTGSRSATPCGPAKVRPVGRASRFGASTSLRQQTRRAHNIRSPRNAIPNDASTTLTLVEVSWQVSSEAMTRVSVEQLAQPNLVATVADGGLSQIVLPLVAFLGGFGLYKTAVYWRVQFITAAMIGKHVPPNAKRVLEYGCGQGKNMYYYPKTIGMVVGIDPDAKEDLLIQVSVASSIPFVAKKQSLESNSGQAAGTIDAVVCTGALGAAEDPEVLVQEAARILKPGAPLVFVEDLGALGEKRNVLDALTTSKSAEQFFQPAEYDSLWATLPFAPTAIGVVVRKGGDGDTSKGVKNKGATGKKEKPKDDFEQSLGLSGGKRSRKNKR